MEGLDARQRLQVGLVALLLYVVAFGVGYRMLGPGMAALVIVPVIVLGWATGPLGGLAAGLFSVPLNAVLLGVVLAGDWRIVLEPESLEGAALVTGVGAMVGLLSSMGRRLDTLVDRSGSGKASGRADEADPPTPAQAVRSYRTTALGHHVGGIAHDFNNILNVVVANAELASSLLFSDPHEARVYLEDLTGAARRGARLVKKLLSFARGRTVELESTDLAERTRSVERTLERLLPPEVELNLRTDPDAPPVLADFAALEQVLMNLATNARDAMPDGGVLEITVTDETVDVEEGRRIGEWMIPGRYTVLRVRDTGVGMDARTRDRIFEAFYSTKDTGRGTGLGMAVAYGIMKQHQGFIQVESAPGTGTTVTLYFPVAGAVTPPAASNIR